MMSRLPIYCVYTGARQYGRQLVLFCIISAMSGLNSIALAEGTKQLEPEGAPLNSVSKIVLSRNTAEYRIPFALVNCHENFRLNIRISDFKSEKIYLGFGEIINYFYDSIVYTDVQYQLKDPSGAVVAGYSLRQLPRIPGSAGFISTRNEVDAGPDIDMTNTEGYNPLVITPAMNGDYIIEFEIPHSSPGKTAQTEMRVFKYFDATVAKGNSPIPGRLWSKAWQLGSRAVNADIRATYSLFYIYTNDSIVTRFDCNGLAGGVWAIYSNEWGSSTTGAWSERRRSRRGNASVQPEYKIFLSDPDSLVFPSGHIGELISFYVNPDVCDTVITFETLVSKGGNIEIRLDIDPPDPPGSFGPEDVQLGYNVTAGHNRLLPAWDGKDGNGIPVANEATIKANVRFLNGLSNVPLYDVEDNPRGFKVDIQRPEPASGSKLKIYWDDTKLPALYFPTSNVTDGCIYNGIGPQSGCHSWTKAQNLGDTNTINSWWYLTTDEILEAPVTVRVRPSSGHITGKANICKGQAVSFSTPSIPFAMEYIWQLSVPGFSADVAANAPETSFVYKLNESIPAGEYLVSVFGRNPVCGDGEIVNKQFNVHNRPKTAFTYQNPCQSAGIIFTDQSNPADAILNKFTWVVDAVHGNKHTFQGNPAVIVFDTTGNYNVSLIATDLLGCIDTASSIITVKAKPDCAFVIIENPGISNGELHFDNLSTGASAYAWDFGNNVTSNLIEPVIKYDLEGNYAIRLVATNLEGCKDTAIIHYYYMPGFWLPNAFSPDNNGSNDIFRPITQRTTLDPYQFIIYDRWGQLIFKSTDPLQGWDGTLNGKPCNTGSYIYFVQYREAEIGSSEIITLRGRVSLIR